MEELTPWRVSTEYSDRPIQIQKKLMPDGDRYYNGKDKYEYQRAVEEYYRPIIFDLTRIELINPLDYSVLFLLLDAYVDFIKADDYLIENGKTYETVNSRGGIEYKDFLEVKHKDLAKKDIAKYLQYFGMTPQSRGEFKTTNKETVLPTIPLEEYD